MPPFVDVMLAMALALAPTPASERPAARAAERALDHFNAGRYAEAREEIAKAYSLEPWPQYLYARARIEQADGRCEVANEFYRLYLAQDPPPRAATLSKRAIAECERELADRGREDEGEAVANGGAATPPSTSPTRPPPTDVPPPVVDVPPPRPWYKDGVGWGLFGSGVGVLAIGFGLFGRALVDDRDAGRSGDHAEFDKRLREAKVLSPIGIAGISLGAALVVGGAVRWAVVSRKRRTASRLAIGATGIGIRW